MAGSSTHSGSESSKLALKNKEIQFIKTTVEEHPVVIFSKSFCKYCRTARSILDSIGVDYKILELDKRCDGPVLQDALEEMTNARTVPRVFIKGQCIGGCSDLQTLHETGQLHNMLGDEVD